MIRYNVRIKLSDFINTAQEEQIIAMVYTIGEETRKKVFLKLWYTKEEITQDEIVAFVKRYETMLGEIGTNIRVGEHETWTQKSWFNIRKFGTTTETDYRHEYFYNDATGILTALTVFRGMLVKMDDMNEIQKPSPSKKENGGRRGYKVTIKKVPNV